MAKLETIDRKKKAYDPKEDGAYQAAQGAVEALEKNAPVYKSTYRQQLEALYKELSQSRPFSYSAEADPLYRQYRDQYITQGRLAMEDTQGQAAALTGGYGNTYAQSVGQQAYQGYLRQLNQAVPELYALAQERYREQKQEKQTRFDTLQDMEAEEYRRFIQETEAYAKELAQAQKERELAYDRGYRAWLDAYEQAYQQARDQEKDRQWEAEFQEDRRRYDQKWQKENAPAGKTATAAKTQQTKKEEKEYVLPPGRVVLL